MTKSSCCPSEKQNNQPATSCCGPEEKTRIDYLLWVSLVLVASFYCWHWLLPSTLPAAWLATIAETVFTLMNTMWFGLFLGIVMLAILSKIPREFVIASLGTNKGVLGVFRAALAGVLLDLCNHGILMVGAKLYERGANLGQVMAFLIASPWNSFSLTFVLISLIGFSWTLLFVVLSAVVAIVVGVICNALVKKGLLPNNANTQAIADDFQFWPEAKAGFSSFDCSWSVLQQMLISGLKDSKMVLRWVFFGVLLAALIRAFFSAELFADYFGPTVLGLLLTVVAATVIEVCSEGSTPIAADLLTRAQAPGNSFAFLMTGAATDYTEIMVLKEATKSWKIAFVLPLLSVPQVLAIAWLMNQFS